VRWLEDSVFLTVRLLSTDERHVGDIPRCVVVRESLKTALRVDEASDAQNCVCV
jgi:hypothetical protein